MIDEFKGLMWAYRAVFKQTHAGGGLIRIRVAPAERTLFLYGLFGPDDYAADRTVTGVIRDSVDNIIGHVLFPSPVDNERIPIFQWNDVDAIVNRQTLDLRGGLLVGGGEQVSWDWASMVQNEEVTFAIRALVQGIPPSVTTTSSGGTVTITTTYDKVI